MANKYNIDRTATANRRKEKKMKKYRVQAILIDATGNKTIETIINSYTTPDYEAALDQLMKKHKSCNHYLYNVLDIDTDKLIYSSMENKYYR